MPDTNRGEPRVPGCTGRVCLAVMPCESPCDPPEPEVSRMPIIERTWLALSPGEPTTTNIVGDEADLADYREQNWIIQGPFVLEAQLQGAVDRIAVLEMALDMAANDAERFTVQQYVEMAERKIAAVYGGQ